MKIGFKALAAYGASRVQKEALMARTVEESETQVRIAQNSDNRIVLLNLALNNNLSEEAVQELYNRDKSYLTNRLNNLGYTKSFSLF